MSFHRRPFGARIGQAASLERRAASPRPSRRAEAVAFLNATVLYILARGEVQGVTIHDAERRRTLVMAVMLGDAGAKGIGKVAERTGQHWARQLVRGIPMAKITAVNKVLGRHFVTKYGTKQGILVLGMVLPFGIGAVIGGTANAVFSQGIITASNRAFGAPFTVVGGLTVGPVAPSRPLRITTFTGGRRFAPESARSCRRCHRARRGCRARAGPLLPRAPRFPASQRAAYGMAVADAEEARLDFRDLLAAVEAAPPVDAVDVLAAELARMLRATEVSLLVANVSGTAAVRMSHVTAADGGMADGRNERTEPLPLDGSTHHRVLTSQEHHVEPHGDGWRVLVPVTERGDAIGILELTIPREPDDEALRYLRSAAHALAYTLIASRRHTDLFDWAQRDVPFSLPAEVQRRLLPDSFTVEAGPFTLAGWLEPAASVGGDTFDYSIDREYLYASVTDAMGHSIRAALLATLTVGSLRNTRRSVASPSEQADAANTALIESAAADEFVTGQILRIRLADGAVDIVNAGHPLPWLLRAGAAAEVALAPGPPLGVEGSAYATERLQLKPGDRLLILTDGFLERNASLAIGDILVASADQHPREFVRELARNVLAATGGDLRDDATVLCIDWYGPGGVRNATGGTSLDRATSN